METKEVILCGFSCFEFSLQQDDVTSADNYFKVMLSSVEALLFLHGLGMSRNFFTVLLMEVVWNYVSFTLKLCNF